MINFRESINCELKDINNVCSVRHVTCGNAYCNEAECYRYRIAYQKGRSSAFKEACIKLRNTWPKGELKNA